MTSSTARKAAGSVAGLRFTFAQTTREALQTEATRRGIPIGRLIGELLERLVEDSLIAAVLDDGK